MHVGRDAHRPYPGGRAQQHAGNDGQPVAGNDDQPIAIGVARSFRDLLAQAITSSLACRLTCVFARALVDADALRPPDGCR